MNAITRHNYEEYFILYLDNELSADDRRSVEAFVQLHPDLHDELDLLLQSKLEPDTSISYAGKEELMFGNNMNGITLSNYDEWLTLYVDNELQPEQQLAVEQFAKQHPAVAKDLYILQQTKLPVEAIVFPGKESLYRREEKTRRIGWWKVAAAAAIVLGVVSTIVIATNKNKKSESGIANSGDKEKTLPVIDNNNGNKNNVDPKVVQPQSSNDELPQDIVNNTTDPTRNRSNIDNSTVKNQSPKKNINKQQVPKEMKDDLKNVKNDQVARLQKELLNQNDQQATPGDNKEIKRPANYYGDYAAAPLTEDKETRINPAVTFANHTALNQQTMPVDIEDGGVQQGSKRNGLRGFLRKVTRTFEKTTNISATDDDDRLLVGGLAIRLK